MIGILIAAIVVLYAIIILLGVSVYILFKHVDREKKIKDGFNKAFENKVYSSMIRRLML